jgi:hypothetical protein
MGWQDDLTALDAARTAGGVDAPEYRRRKEEILAKATEPTRNVPRMSRKSGPDNPDADSSDAGNSDRDSERPTESMLPPPWERATARPVPEPARDWPAPHADSAVSATPPRAEPYFPAVPPPPPQQPGAEQQPQFPPVPAQQQPQFPPAQQQPTQQVAQSQGAQQQSASQQPPFPHQGQYQGQGQWAPANRQAPGIEHVVDGPKPRSRKPLLFAGIGILVLALIAIGIFVVPWSSLTATPKPPPNATSAPPPAPNPTGPATVPADVAAALPPLPGTALAAPVRQPVNALEKDGYYDERIVSSINKAGTNSMVLRESVAGGDLIYLNAVIPMTSARGCQTTAATINDYQRGLGLKDDDKASFAANTVTLSATVKAGTYFRSAYCSGRMTVLVGAATANKTKSAELQKGFLTASKGVAGRLPAN